jgi:hypothetical protein
MDPSCLPSLLTGDIGGLSMCRDTREPIPRRSPSNVPGTVVVKHSADGKLYPPPLTCQYLPPNTSLPTYGTTCYLPSMCLPYVVSPAPCCNLPTCSGSPLALELSPSPATSKMSHPPPRHHLSSRHPLADPANTRPFRLTNTQPTTHLTQTWVGFCFFEEKIVTLSPLTQKRCLPLSLTTAHTQSFFQIVLKPYLHGHQGSSSKA